MSLNAHSWPVRKWLPWHRKTVPQPPAPVALPVMADTTNAAAPFQTWQVTETTYGPAGLPTTGDVLRRLRKARGLTQADVSALTKALPGGRGISPSTVSAVELWKTNLDPETVESYLRAMEQWGA